MSGALMKELLCAGIAYPFHQRVGETCVVSRLY